MAYLCRYSLTVEWVGPNGVGMNAVPGLMGASGPTQGQKLVFFDSGAVGSNTFTATDINNIIASVTTDLTAQMTAQQTRVQNFSSGGG